MNDEQIFIKSVELPHTQRKEYLDEVYRNRPNDRAAMEAMIEAHFQTDSLLDADALCSTTDRTEDKSQAHLSINNYKLLQKIGEGGFGVVYMAEQLKPVKRKVALKVIKPGMDSAAVVARFESERQALAMMDHSNIARVFDGGSTDEGRPYFVMELVKGVPITTYCDDNKLRTTERLALFVDVCRAVQHAHHKGIVHRDIKPSNVMVTLHDGLPVVKVIDFGVAKAMHVELTEKTLFTAYGQMIGTPQYMSPEQAEMSGLDVDTRCDVYSLGVLLYELLTGTTPLESAALRKVGLAGMQQMIKETEPPKPSVRLSSSGDRLTHIAQHRSVTPDRLSKEVRGDLDWIVMKTLEKDRNRRYDTANGLARDIERFLDGDAVEACPPSFVYRTRRLVSRNKVAVGIASLLFAMLCGCLGAVELARREAVAAREQATHNLRSLQDALTTIAFAEACNGDLEAIEDALDKLRLTGPEPTLVETLEGIALYTSGQLTECVAKMENVIQQDPGNRIAQSCLHWASFYIGDLSWHTRFSDYDLEPGKNDYEQLWAAMQSAYGANDAASDSIRLFDDLISRRRWPIAYAFRAEALRYRFTFGRNMDDIHQAIEDSRLARLLLPDSNYAKQVEMMVLGTACEYANAFEDEVTPGVRKRWLSDAAAAADYYQDKFNLLEASGQTLIFLRLTDPQRADTFERLLDEKYTTRHSKLADWFANKDFEAVLSYEAPESFYSHFFQAIVKAEQGNRDQAIEWIRDLSERHKNHRASHAFATTLRLLGAHEEARRSARHLADTGIGYGWTHYGSQFQADQITAEEFLAHAYPFAVSMSQAHYHIGVRELANGHRTKAIEHLEAVVATGRYGWPHYYRSRAMLKRLKDPTDDFPNWIDDRDDAQAADRE